MLNYSRLLGLLTLFGISFTSLATHIVGGELSYECLGNNVFRVTLKVYRDCLNGQAPFDRNAAVTVYDANNNLVSNNFFQFPGSTRLSYSVIEPCFSYSSSICVEEAIYSEELTLPYKSGGYQLAYQRCCRNAAITNLLNPEDNGATYTIKITEAALNQCNSSPYFTNYPPSAVCVGEPLTLNYSATEFDGDSLVYSFFTPLHGGGKQNNVSNPTGFQTPMPSPAAPPPYQQVTWRPQFNTQYQVDANPAFSINPETGIITGTPNTQGQYVFGVKVSEYRNSILMSEVYRDIQFQVVPCYKNNEAKIAPQASFCAGQEINFINLSGGTGNFAWNFGDPNTLSDTSRATNPSYYYSDTGRYVVQLVTFPGYSCADTTTDTFFVYPLLKADFALPDTQCLTNNSFDFSASGSYSGGANFQWDFGSLATVNTSNMPQQNNVSFPDTGNYPVTLTIRENGCESFITKKVSVYPHPRPKFVVKDDVVCAPYKLNITDKSYAKTPLTYLWDFGSGEMSNSNKPIYFYTDSGLYTINLTVITSNGCKDTVTSDFPVNIKVNPSPTANYEIFPKSTSIYEPEITFTNLASANLNCLLDVGYGAFNKPCNEQYSFQQPGIYTTRQVVMNSFGCTDTLAQNVEITPEFAFFAPNAFTPNGDGLNDFFKPTIYGVTEYQFQIFDRWGRVIFQTFSTLEAWDGTISTKTPAQQDSYSWRVDAIDYLGNNQMFIGNVILLK